jgi:hypothetical protein
MRPELKMVVGGELELVWWFCSGDWIWSQKVKNGMVSLCD